MWVWASSRRWWRKGNPVCCSPWGHKELDLTEWLNNNNWKFTMVSGKYLEKKWNLGKFSAITSSNIFLGPFSLSLSPPVTPIIWMLVCCPRGLLGCLHFFSFFPIFCFAAVIYNILSSRSLICSACFSALFFLMYFIFVHLFFSSSRSLGNISCNFSIVFLRSWIIISIIILTSFSGRLPITLFINSCFSRVLSCPVIWDIILALLARDLLQPG